MALARSGRQEAGPGLLSWWIEELRALLPRRWRQAAPRRHTLLLQVERPFARVYERRGRRLESVGSLVLGDASPGTPTPPVETRLRQALARHKNATVLILGEDDALTVTDALPAAAEGDIARIMAHKLDLLTPWSAEQSYTAQKVLGRRRDGMLEVLVVAASRARLDELLQQLAAVGVSPMAVDVALDAEAQRTAGVDLLRAGLPERRGRALLLALLTLLVAAIAVGAGWAGWQVYERQLLIGEQTRLTAELEQRLGDMPALRARIDAMRAQADFFAADRRGRPSPLVVLEVLSRLLPDTVWLTEVTLDGTELSIGGMAEDASALIPLVEAAPEFEQVRFLAPSTKMIVRGADGGEREVERFSLRAVVDPTAGSAL